MRVRGKPVLWIALSLSLLPSVAFSQPPDLTYHTVPTCVAVHTAVAGGAFAANEIRTYKVVGDVSFASQGGSSIGCGVPGFSNGIAQAQAVEINVVAYTPAGTGYLKVYPAGQPIDRAMLFFSSGVSIADTGAAAVSQAAGAGGDITIQATAATHVIVKVVGYYTRAVQTVYVHPVPGDHTASGARLINALADIVDASATKRYVLKVEPGIYDLGSTMLEMKPYVDIEGSGQEATVIQGVGNNDETLLTGNVEGADFAELRDLQVKSIGATYNSAIAIALDEDDTTIRNVTATASGASANWGIRMVGSNPTIEEVNINVSGAGYNYGMVTDFHSAPIVRRTVMNVIGTGTSGSKYGIWTEDGGCPKELSDVEINVSGGAFAYGIQEANANHGCTLMVRSSSISVDATNAYGIYAQAALTTDVLDSKIRAAGATSYGLYSPSTNFFSVKGSEIAGATATVDAFNANIAGTMLDGGAASAAACAGVYDESYTFYASTCP